jgi:hypothetical protein
LGFLAFLPELASNLLAKSPPLVLSCGYKFTSEGKLLLESKQDMRKRGVPSPDEADAVALTFSEPDGSAFVRDPNFHRSLLDRYQGAYV